MEKPKIDKTQRDILKRVQKEIFDNGDGIKKIEIIEPLTWHDFQGEQSGLSEYKITTKNGIKNVFGFYSSDKKSKRFYNKKIILQKLDEYNFPTADLSIARIIRFYPKTNIFLREKVEGNTLLEMIESKDKNYEKVIKSSARWIARMHNLTPENNIFQSNYKIAKKNYKNYLKSIESYLPEKTNIIKDILTKVKKIRKESKTSIIHGDFQAQNVIYNPANNKTTVIDYDWAGIGDPLYDVASFLIQLDYKTSKLLKDNEIIELKNQFIQEYQKASGRSLDSVAQEINTYQAEIIIQRISWIIGFVKNPFDVRPNESEQRITIENLIKKAVECVNDNKNINLKIYSYSTL